ncbi:DUF732 domain-containing protein [Pseudonocardia sp. ICBG601]|uniref:DUF732 domain-containing protein n=1 Tax=Pseudonocardia sp. ICBG601 TaxID=2846759 RepID=UPI001CF67407|nr:DUF732 domain-containing protein [Pseudonocardia sp. ICBG601]
MTRFVRLIPLAGLALLVSCGSAEPTSAPAAAPPGSADLTAAEQAFVDEVAGIAPPLAENPERLAGRGANTCDSLGDGRPRDQVVAQAVERFSGGTYTVTADQAAAIVDAAERTVCAG